MIGLDTNVLLRCFIDDDPPQATLARQFVKDQCTPNNPGFVDRVALCEFVWVLSRGYRYDRAQIAAVVENLLASQDIVLEDHECARTALRIFGGHSIGFADALIGAVNRARGCEVTATFDRDAAKLDGFVRVG